MSMNHPVARYLEKHNAQQEEIDSNSEPKKPMSVPGFEHGLLGQNAVSLQLVPPPPWNY